MESEPLPARRRSARAALIVGPAAVGLGVTAHLASGGAAPPGPVLVAMTALVSLIAAAAARTLLPPWAIAVGSGALQQALHLLFTALAGPNAPLFPSTGHLHSHSAVAPALIPSGSPPPMDLHLLVVTHVAAALVTAWLAIAANRVTVRAAAARMASPTRSFRPRRIRRNQAIHGPGPQASHEHRVWGDAPATRT